MKKIISATLILTLLMSAFGVIPTYSAYSEGDGTVLNPYVIKTAEDFMNIKNNVKACYLLVNDITLPKNYVPFDFMGTLSGKDGKNHFSITVDITTDGKAGLFTSITESAKVENIRIKGVIKGTVNVGGIAGSSSTDANGYIKNCVNEAFINGSQNVGGIVGLSGSLVENCVNLGNVSGITYVGGIAGQISTITVNMCQNFGDVSATNYAGGIVGRSYGFVTYSQNTGNVSANTYAGGIIGVVNGNRSSAYLYNAGVVTANSSVEDNDCGGIVGGVLSGSNRRVDVSFALNMGDVISPKGNYNPMYPSYKSELENNYIKFTESYYVSETLKDDGKEGTKAITNANDADMILKEIQAKMDIENNVNNSQWMDDILSELGAELAMYKGVRTALYKKDGKAVMARMDPKQASIVPYVKNSTVMVPVGFVSEVFGADVSWNGKERTVKIKTEDKEILFYINSKTATVNGESYSLVEPAYIESGRTYVPVRAVCEMFGKQVLWKDGLILVSEKPITLTDKYYKKARGIWFIPASDVTVKLKNAQPGDEIIIANGTYDNVKMVVNFKATEEMPLIIRAETPGKVIFTGDSHFNVSGEYVTLKDFYFNEAIGPVGTRVNLTNASYCRVTGLYLYRTGHDTNGQIKVVNIGSNSRYNRVDHNTFERPQGVCVHVTVNALVPEEQMSRFNQIDHNYFLDVRDCDKEIPTSSSNGMEVVQLGTNGEDMRPYKNIVEYNRFEDIVGDMGEGICLKSNANIIRYNTFVNSYMSGLSMRANFYSVIHGNFFFRTKYGMRIYGSGHTFTDNYTYNDYRAGFVGHAGIAEGYVLDGETQAVSDFHAEGNITIYPNHAGIMLSDNYNSEGATFCGAKNLTFKNNTFYLRKGTVLKDYYAEGINYENNKVNLSGAAVMGTDDPGFVNSDVPLVFDGEIYLPEDRLDFDKQGLISVEESGPSDRWWVPLLRYTPKYFFDIEPDHAPTEIIPKYASLKINTGEEYNLRGLYIMAAYDDEYLYHDSLEVQYENIAYEPMGDNLKIENGYLKASKPGNEKLKLTYRGVSAIVDVSVVAEYDDGVKLLKDTFTETSAENYSLKSGKEWTFGDGKLISPTAASMIINNSKMLKGDYEISCDVTIEPPANSSNVNAGLIVGYQETPNLIYYRIPLVSEGMTSGGIYEKDDHVDSKKSEQAFGVTPGKKHNVKVRVIGKMLVVLVDDAVYAVYNNFKCDNSNMGFMTGAANAMTVENLSVSPITSIPEAEPITDLNLKSDRIDSRICNVTFDALDKEGVFYRVFRRGFPANDTNTNENFTDILIQIGEVYDYSVKVYDSYGRVIAEGTTTTSFETDGLDEFFSIIDAEAKVGSEEMPYAPAIRARARGYRPGVAVLGDRTAWVASEVPERFIDCGIVSLSNNHRKNVEFSKGNDDFYRFKINRSATVYVFLAPHQTKIPDWLSTWKYEPISDLVYSGTASPVGCYSKHFEVEDGKLETVYLGGMPGGSTAMYTVLVKPDVMPEYVKMGKFSSGSF